MCSKSMVGRVASPRGLESSSWLAALAAIALLGCSDASDGNDTGTFGTFAGASGSAVPSAGTGGVPGAGMLPVAGMMPGVGTAGATATAGSGGTLPIAGMAGAGVVMPNAGSSGSDPGAAGSAGATPVGDPSGWNDPGTEPFVPVPEADVAAECKLDIDMLKASGYVNGAVFRYGKLCYSNGNIDSPYQVFSVTKSVAGTTMAAAYYETRMNAERILPSDPVSKWGGSGSIRISEYGGMVAGAGSGREWGSHAFAYDTLGTNLRVTMGPMEMSLSQGSVGGFTTLDAVRDNLFAKLGVKGTWPTGVWGTGANISLTDMARIGIALTHGGWYNGEQVLDPDWVYWMTHPHWEDAQTSYGMYLWLNHRGGATGIGGTLDASGAGPPDGDPCAPAAIWQSYPHPPSEAPDCMATAGAAECEQMHDTGVFSAQGLGGQFIVGHRGLDLVMVAQNYSGQGGPMGLWALVRPSLVALDPMFMGDEAAFCEAYGHGNYAPDLLVEPVQPPMQ